jgi:Probable Zinc-ribbon domain
MNNKESLKESHPALAVEAYGWDPEKYTAGSGKAVEWKCSLGHIYITPIYSRTSKKPTGCPYCANRKVLAGFNDLETTHPEIASEADGWNPKDFSAGMGKKMSWTCREGHKYESVIQSRSKGIGCPVCSNKKVQAGVNDLESTHPDVAKEAHGWDPKQFVSGSDKIMEWKCSKGHLFKSAIVNRAHKKSGCSVCQNKTIVAGINDLASTHPALAAEASGWNPMEIGAESHKKMKWQCAKGHIWNAMVNSRSRGRGCPVCANQVLQIGINDLKTTDPEIAKQAYEWDPSSVTAGSKVKKLWKCNLGHIWDAPVNTRFRESGNGCPYCSNHRLLVGFNDFATTHPHLLDEVNGWDPQSLIAGARAKKSWKCSEGHVWETSVGARTGTKESGCPTCAKYGFDPNKDGWLYYMAHEEWGLVQIGITNVPNQRLNKHKKSGWDLIDLKGPMKGDLTRNWESDILNYVENRGIEVGSKKIAGAFDGYSESWKQEDYFPQSLKEIMEEVRNG